MAPTRSDHNKQMTTLTVMTLSGFHCLNILRIEVKTQIRKSFVRTKFEYTMI
jgi:hypothetical protein